MLVLGHQNNQGFRMIGLNIDSLIDPILGPTMVTDIIPKKTNDNQQNPEKESQKHPNGCIHYDRMDLFGGTLLLFLQFWQIAYFFFVLFFCLFLVFLFFKQGNTKNVCMPNSETFL